MRSNILTSVFIVLVSLFSETIFGAFQELTYRTRSEIQLHYVVAAPSFAGFQKYPLWVFQPGDGNVFDTFQPKQYQPMMEQFTQAFGVALIMPELRRNLYVADLKKYCQLDFFHRIVDASKLIDSAKKLNFVDSSKIIIFGHSAGGEYHL